MDMRSVEGPEVVGGEFPLDTPCIRIGIISLTIILEEILSQDTSSPLL